MKYFNLVAYLSGILLGAVCMAAYDRNMSSLAKEDLGEVRHINLVAGGHYNSTLVGGSASGNPFLDSRNCADDAAYLNTTLKYTGGVFIACVEYK